MSINTETQRLIQAKADLKTSIEKRGVNIESEDRIDIYYEFLDSCPFAVSGEFVPNDDLKQFSITGLPFTPKSLLLICSDQVALGNNRNPNTLVLASTHKGLYSSMLYTDESASNRLGNVKPGSSFITWYDDGVSINIPDSITATFQMGLYYNYYITGGIE